MKLAIRENQVGLMGGVGSNIYDTLVYRDDGVPIFGLENKPSGSLFDFDGNLITDVELAQGKPFTADAVTGFVIDVNGDLQLYHYSDANLDYSSFWKLWGDLKYSFTVNRGIIDIKSNLGTTLHRMQQGDTYKCILCGMMNSANPFENGRTLAYLVAEYTKGADNTVTGTYTWRSASWVADDIAQNHGYGDAYHGVFNTLVTKNPGSMADLENRINQMQTDIDQLNTRVSSVEVSNNSRYVSR